MVLNGTAISRATDDAVKPGILAKKLASSPGQIFSLTKRTNGNGSAKKGPGIYCKGDL